MIRPRPFQSILLIVAIGSSFACESDDASKSARPDDAGSADGQVGGPDTGMPMDSGRDAAVDSRADSPVSMDGGVPDADAGLPLAGTVGGTVTGLSNTMVTLQLNGADDLTLSADGMFSFPTILMEGETYDVTATAGPMQVCLVANGSGTVGTTPIMDVTVTCTWQFFFRGSNAAGTGEELYKTDGTAAGTVLVKEINPGVVPASQPRLFEIFNGKYYFAGNAGAGFRLWETDGTEAGTQMAADLSNPNHLQVFNGELYFRATDTSGSELWKIDAAGSFEQVFDFNGATEGLNPGELTVLGNSLYFTGSSLAAGNELWKTDGTAAGTQMVVDLNPGATGALLGIDEDEVLMIAYNGELYFSADDGTGMGRELWKSDGTASGTVFVTEINPGPAHGLPRYFAELDGLLYFAGEDAANGRELWRTDGTPAGTELVADINPGMAGSNPSVLTAWNGALYFRATTTAVGMELFKYDGVAPPAVVKDMGGALGSGNPRPIPGELFHNVGDWLVFDLFESMTTGHEVWRTDGTDMGTEIVIDLCPGTCPGIRAE